MYESFVVLAYLRHEEKPIEVGYVSSYDKASRLVCEMAERLTRVKDVSYFRIERRCYV